MFRVKSNQMAKRILFLQNASRKTLLEDDDKALNFWVSQKYPSTGGGSNSFTIGTDIYQKSYIRRHRFQQYESCVQKYLYFVFPNG